MKSKSKFTEYQKYMKLRAIGVGEHIVKTGCTIRQCAVSFKMSKSTVWNDAYRLEHIDYDLYTDVMKIIDLNKKAASYRGGVTTKHIYQKRRRVQLCALLLLLSESTREDVK